jgi:hypothetical protein
MFSVGLSPEMDYRVNFNDPAHGTSDHSATDRFSHSDIYHFMVTAYVYIFVDESNNPRFHFAGDCCI